MRHLVIGRGEVGEAVEKALMIRYEVEALDNNDSRYESVSAKLFDVIHVCFPHSEAFESEVERYRREHLLPDGIIIIHSTVPMGTSRHLRAVHSPIRGQHPHLFDSFGHFTKYFGAESEKDCERAAALWKGIDWTFKTFCAKSPEDTEALKLWDTTIYGLNIVLEKEIHRFCQEHGLDFKTVYTHANESYNAGYEAMGRPQYKKYVLEHKEGGIGGHCVMKNCDMLPSYISELVKEMGG